MRVEHWCKLLQRDDTDKHRDTRFKLLPEILSSNDAMDKTYSINELVEQYDHEEVDLVLAYNYE